MQRDSWPITNRPQVANQVANLSSWPCGPPKVMKTRRRRGLNRSCIQLSRRPPVVGRWGSGVVEAVNLSDPEREHEGVFDRAPQKIVAACEETDEL
jgi:hypothetical protein